jgi:RHS repeat-associated protein
LPGAYAGESKTLTTSYYSNDIVASQSQGGITNTFQLDASLRQRQRIQTGGLEGTEVFHYAGASDSPVWTERAGTWTRNIVGIGGELAAIQDSASGIALQLTNLHGDVVATASLSQSATELTATFEFDEFGNPRQAGSTRFGWLGGKQRRTELPSGVIQMGVRSYVPAIGRFMSVDPIPGGSANAYDYANQNPINSYDLTGQAPGCNLKLNLRSRNHRIYSSLTYQCAKKTWPGPHALLKVSFKFERRTKGLVDEVVHGKYETKSSWQWLPSNPYDSRWRHWTHNESYYCGDIGRKYQLIYTVNVKLMSPVNGIVPGHDETMEQKAQVTCQR